MSDEWLYDNDVIIKVCGYRLLDLLLATLSKVRPAILATSVYSLPFQVRRTAKIQDRAAAMTELSRFLEIVDVIEPEPAEIELAALLEQQAVRLALPLEGGESQLVAILAYRAMPVLVTGDKRAIKALHIVGQPDVQGRIACLEQLMATVVWRSGHQAVRPLVCSEPQLDRALASCFACSSEQVVAATIDEGLVSYVSDLRRSSGGLLTAGNDLSAIIA